MISDTSGVHVLDSGAAQASRHGYDALEFSVDDFKKKFFPRSSTAEVVSRVRACVARYNLPTIGALYHVPGGSNAPLHLLPLLRGHRKRPIARSVPSLRQLVGCITSLLTLN
eukprot:SAG31_NODE_7914_length_1566_cov_2.299932_1_plen_112_part_00